ncbi:MAG: response regulator transcription factor [Candidatus Obscuribacterales bacterium]|nr:response regulator transcription factor [Candidatus Obscuribacterales bacterium]
MAKILLVEDDHDLAFTIADFLSRENHVVESVHDGLDGREMLKFGAFDLLVLDWDLPHLTGVEIMKEYRSSGGSAPIIMLTGRDKIEEKESGFETGADDYLTKPFQLRELSARIKSLLRRPAALVSNVLTVRDISLDTEKHRATRAGVDIKLTPKDFALLEFLMRHPDELFSSETILARVWRTEEETSNDALRVAIRRLRKALGEGEDAKESIIENVSRMGYRLKS